MIIHLEISIKPRFWRLGLSHNALVLMKKMGINLE
jgi:hypothetical protein